MASHRLRVAVDAAGDSEGTVMTVADSGVTVEASVVASGVVTASMVASAAVTVSVEGTVDSEAVSGVVVSEVVSCSIRDFLCEAYSLC
jgi:hypothetical protein